MNGSEDIGMEVIDGRDALGVVILRDHDGQIMSEIKGMKVDKLTAAKLFYQLAKQLKAMHDAESEPDLNRAENHPKEG